jgi:hypothetical protein
MRSCILALMSSSCFLLVPPASAQQTVSCGFEDGASTILGSFGNIAAAENVAQPVHEGTRSLRLLESPEGGTPQAFVAFVEGLEDGDVIDACFWAYDTSPNMPPSIRIWAHYASNGNVDSNRGSAGGDTTYSGGTGSHDSGGWTQLCHRWEFESLGGYPDALVIEARLYSPVGRESEFFLDEVEVTVSSQTARVTLPCPRTGGEKLESHWGSIKSLYR